MDPYTDTTKGIAPRFAQEKLQALLQTRIDFHAEEADRLKPEVPRLKDELAKLETDIRMARDTSDGAMGRLQLAQQSYMNAVYQLELHQRWATFLAFQREHLAPGTHILELDDLRALDLVEIPTDFGFAMIPRREPIEHKTLRRLPGGGMPFPAPFAGFGQ